MAFSEYLNFKGLVVEKFLAIHNEIFPKFDILMCNVPKYTLDAVGSWQMILPMPNLERAY